MKRLSTFLVSETDFLFYLIWLFIYLVQPLTAALTPAGFNKSTFLPLLEFAYTSMLTFNFSIMADIANLARHLLMKEVLQLCEFVHKQVEEQKLDVYQKGDVHTVLSDQQAAEEGLAGESGAYMVAIQGDGSAVVTQGGGAITGEPIAFVTAPGEAFAQQPVIVAAPVVAEVAHGEDGKHEGTVTLIADGPEGETMTVVTHSGQAGASESLAMVSACLAMEQPQVAEGTAYVISVDQEQVAAAEVAPAVVVPPPQQEEEAPAETAPPPVKRKRGRPAKVRKDLLETKEVKEVPPPEEEWTPEEVPTDRQEVMPDDPSRRRLRQRSMAEGGYARLHMGLENEEEEKKVVTPPPRAVAQKVKIGHNLLRLLLCSY